jgi:hypothetical protein
MLTFNPSPAALKLPSSSFWFSVGSKEILSKYQEITDKIEVSLDNLSQEPTPPSLEESVALPAEVQIDPPLTSPTTSTETTSQPNLPENQAALLQQLEQMQEERLKDAHAIGQLEGRLAEVDRELNRLVEENMNLQINLVQWQRGSVLALIGFSVMLLLALLLIIILR